LGVPFGNALRFGLGRSQEIGGYDLVLNVEIGPAHKAFATALGGNYLCGPALSESGRGEWEFPDDPRGDLWRDRNWVDPQITDRYQFVDVPFIGEIFYRLAYREGTLPRYRFPQAEPPFPVPGVLISTGASLPEKLWPVSKWRDLLKGLDSQVGLLGAPPKRQAEFYHSTDDENSLVTDGLVTDLRGKLTLPEVVGALAAAEKVFTIDNGILHFAAANDVPTVGLYRKEIAGLWAPPNPNLIVLTPQDGVVAEISVDSVRTASDTLGS
jgi:ADP-heptose:LPS heptosyltransferase